MTTNIKLGPTSLLTSSGSPFLISREDWEKINKYVQKIISYANTYPDDVSGSYEAEVIANARIWDAETFSNIKLFAQQLKVYGQEFVRDKYGALKEALMSQDRTEVNQICEKIAQVLDKNLSLNEDIISEIDNFISAAKKVSGVAQIWGFMGPGPVMPHGESLYSQHQKDWLNLMTNLAMPPINVFEECVGVWKSNESDLEYIKSLLDQEQTIDDTFIAGLNLDVAIDSWEKVAQDADDFIQFSGNL